LIQDIGSKDGKGFIYFNPSENPCLELVQNVGVCYTFGEIMMENPVEVTDLESDPI